MSVSSYDEPHSARYIPVLKPMQLIPKPFNGNPLDLMEFIQNVEATYEVIDPSDYRMLLRSKNQIIVSHSFRYMGASKSSFGGKL
jgi:hypothetical protein